ncbi:thiamine phosphate synthase [bacterium]|nr:thiamine phosphate synthase [bacterium]
MNDRAAWRMLDAAADRASEGLRVAGEVVRFFLADAALTARLRDLRQALWSVLAEIPAARARMVDARDSVHDPGRDLPGPPRSADAALLFSTNLHRAQESLRCIEEVLRALAPAQAAPITDLRYQCYELEKDAAPALATFDKRRKLDFELYVVTGAAQSRGRGHLEVVAAALAGGAGCIQLRDKHLPARQLLPLARDVAALCRERNATFIVNDHIDVALSAGADGVHLGQDDFPLSEARAIVGMGMILGASTHSLDQARRAEAEGADYLNVGPVFPTQTKEGGVTPVGVELITAVKNAVTTPQTCMGGINADNVAQVIKAGAERVAVVSAVVGAPDVAGAARDLLARIRAAKAARKPVAAGPRQ